jgi:peptidoglycan/xylan/chitin deacetylase (PgdA/CDA1 family)
MTRRLGSILAFAALVCGLAPMGATADEMCKEPRSALGLERVVEIDAATGPLYGDISVLTREESFLQPGEVVLTFDDGPMPWITKSILDTLDRFCTKATFFSVGRMAIAYPASIKDILARGHTLGSHTWSHPLNLKRRPLSRAIDEIEKGFSAIAMAAGQPIAPFFRFPGLSDSDPMMAHLQERGIAAFTVDVVSNDSYIGNADRLASYTLAQIDKRRGGIVLFHDIKSATAKALPEILAGLKTRGYKVVHLRAKAPLVPVATYDEELTALLAKSSPAARSKAELVATAPVAADTASDAAATAHLLPFFGSPAVLKTLSGADAEVITLTPPARSRVAASTREHPTAEVEPANTGKRERVRTGQKKKPARTANRPSQPPPFSLFGF